LFQLKDFQIAANIIRVLGDIPEKVSKSKKWIVPFVDTYNIGMPVEDGC